MRKDSNVKQEVFGFFKVSKPKPKPKPVRKEWTTERMREALTGDTRQKITWRWRAFEILAKSTIAFAGRDGIGFNQRHEPEMMNAWAIYTGRDELPPNLVSDIHRIVPIYSRQLARYANEKV